MSNERIKVKGKELIKTIKKLLKEGNIQYIIIKNSEGKKVYEFPLGAGVAGLALLPIYSALAFLILASAEYTIEVIRKE